MVTGWSVDTRTLQPGDLFFALRGPNHDGHAYIDVALEKGAVAVVGQALAGAQRSCVVPDSLAALQNLAAWAREQWGGRVVGVTGSAGKTTAKDAIAHLLATELPVGKTVGNLNNHVGVPLSILRLPDESRVGVLEMGMNHAGEIRALAAIAKPDIGVVTNVGYAHVEAFDSIEGVALAKRELIEALDPQAGIAVLNADDPRVLRFREIHPGRAITFGFSRCGGCACDGHRLHHRRHTLPRRRRRFLYDARGPARRSEPAGRHRRGARFRNSAGAPARTPWRRSPSARMRGERLEHNGVIIWNDCYNSNPEAVGAMLDVLRATPARRHIAVLGEMLELGHAAEMLHRQAGRMRGGKRRR